MKVIAINASPNGNSGITSLILTPFLEGMSSVGADVESFNIAEMDIQPCRACTEDFEFMTEGNCRCDDDMNLLYPRMRESYIWVFATPSYYDNITPQLKNFLDRLEPLFNGEFDEKTLKPKKNGPNGKVALVSTCDKYEIDNFSIIESHIKGIAGIYGREYSGALLRPQAQSFAAMLEYGGHVDDIIKASFESGKRLAVAGSFERQSLHSVRRNVVSKRSFINEITGNTN